MPNETSCCLIFAVAAKTYAGVANAQCSFRLPDTIPYLYNVTIYRALEYALTDSLEV